MRLRQAAVVHWGIRGRSNAGLARGNWGSVGARKWQEHGDGQLVFTVGFSEVAEKITFFEPGTEDDPNGPKHIEKELVGGEARGGPDEQKAE